MAEDVGNLEAEVRSLGGYRDGNCGVCSWIAARDDAAEWDRLMAKPYDRRSSESIQHLALGKAMRRRGFELSDHRIGAHRRERHRVA